MKAKLLFLILLLFQGYMAYAQSSANFDGSNDRVQAPVNQNLNLSTGTIEAYIKTNNAGSGFRGIIVKQYNYGLFLDSNKLTVYDWKKNLTYTFDKDLADDRWHHLVFTFSDAAVGGSKVYLDGLPVMTLTYNIWFFTEDFVAGNGSDYSNVQAFAGQIDHVKIYNRIKSDEEILKNYLCQNHNNNGLVLYWDFEEGSGSTTADLSGSGNTGQFYGSDPLLAWPKGYLCPQIIADYPLDGTAEDLSGFERHGTVYGATPTQDRNGNDHSAFYFDGNGQYIDLGDWESGGAMSFTFWARWGALNVYSRIFDLSNGTRNNDVNFFNWSNSNEVTFYVHNTDIGNYVYIKNACNSE